MPGSERRRHPRRRKDAPLILIEKTPSSGKEGLILRDVSIGGLAFETDLDLKSGDGFEFALYVPSRGWVDGKGRVCWVKPENGTLLCGASIAIREWDQEQLLEKWLKPSGKGLLRFFFPEKGTKPPDD